MRLGLCCLVIGEDASKFKTLRLGTFTENSNKRDTAVNVYRHNLKELIKVLQFCENNQILHYRIPSSLFPFADHKEHNVYWNEFKNCDKEWTDARRSVQHYLENGGRLSTHPDQFCIITSPKTDVNVRGVSTLIYHADMFDRLGVPQTYFCPINIHLSNGNSGSNSGIIAKETYSTLPQNVSSRLVFETEDKSYWTYQRIAEHFPQIPITLDYHHRLINNLNESEEEAHNYCVSTWGDVTPLFHYSEGRDDRLDRAHSDYIERLPVYSTVVDIEIEAKMKNKAILKLRETL